MDLQRSLYFLLLLLPSCCYGVASSRSERVAKLGTTISLQCPVSNATSSQIEWTRESATLRTPLSNSSSNDLTIANARYPDADLYTCTASSGHEHHIQLYVIDLPVFEQPEIENVTVFLHSPFKLPCNARDGNGNPLQVEWTRQNHDLDPKLFRKLSDGSLHIPNVTRDVKGSYICAASTESGRSERLVTIVVKQSRLFAVEPEDATVVQGSPVSFHCSSRESTTIFWKLDTHSSAGPPEASAQQQQQQQTELIFANQKSKDGRIKVFDNNTLVINATDRDRDPDHIVCVLGDVEASARLHIRESFGCDAPLYVQSPNAVSAPSGSHFTLECDVTLSHPDSHIAWFFAPHHSDVTSRLNHTDRVRLLPSGSVQVLFSRSSDSGQYWCGVMCASGERTTLQDSMVAHVRVSEDTQPVVTQEVEIKTPKPRLLVLTNKTAEISWETVPSTCFTLEYICGEWRSTWNRSLPCLEHTSSGHQHALIPDLPAHAECRAALRGRALGSGRTYPVGPQLRFHTILSSPVRITEAQVSARLEGEVDAFDALHLYWSVPSYLYTNFTVKCAEFEEGGQRETESRTLTVSGERRSARVDGLRESTTYQCYLKIVAGSMSTMTDTIELRTPEMLPPPAPANVRLLMYGGRVHLAWNPSRDPPSPVTRYQTWCWGDGATELTLDEQTLSPAGRNYRAYELHSHFDSVTCSVAAFSGPVKGPATNATLDLDASEEADSVLLLKQPWFLAICGIVSWVLLLALCVAFYCNKSSKTNIYGSHQSRYSLEHPVPYSSTDVPSSGWANHPYINTATIYNPHMHPYSSDQMTGLLMEKKIFTESQSTPNLRTDLPPGSIHSNHGSQNTCNYEEIGEARNALLVHSDQFPPEADCRRYDCPERRAGSSDLRQPDDENRSLEHNPNERLHPLYYATTPIQMLPRRPKMGSHALNRHMHDIKNPSTLPQPSTSEMPRHIIPRGFQKLPMMTSCNAPYDHNCSEGVYDEPRRPLSEHKDPEMPTCPAFYHELQPTSGNNTDSDTYYASQISPPQGVTAGQSMALGRRASERLTSQSRC